MMVFEGLGASQSIILSSWQDFLSSLLDEIFPIFVEPPSKFSVTIEL